MKANEKRIAELAAQPYYSSDGPKAVIDSGEFKIHRAEISYGKRRWYLLFTECGVLLSVKAKDGRRSGCTVRGDNQPNVVNLAGVGYVMDPVQSAIVYSHTRDILAAFDCGDPSEAVRRLGQDSCRCCICGSPLRDPDSQARGIGPECIKKIGVLPWYRFTLRQGAR